MCSCQPVTLFSIPFVVSAGAWYDEEERKYHWSLRRSKNKCQSSRLQENREKRKKQKKKKNCLLDLYHQLQKRAFEDDRLRWLLACCIVPSSCGEKKHGARWDVIYFLVYLTLCNSGASQSGLPRIRTWVQALRLRTLPRWCQEDNVLSLKGWT